MFLKLIEESVIFLKYRIYNYEKKTFLVLLANSYKAGTGAVFAKNIEKDC